jgi:ABC-type lipoprotein export system ATPase subunit
MSNLLGFYLNEKQNHTKNLQKIKSKLRVLGLLRLFVFLITAYLIYLNFNNTQIVILIALIGVSLFLFLVSKYTDTSRKKNKLDALIKINTTEIKVLQNDYSDLPFGEEFINSQHKFSYDIDLFGKNSFFQYLNRTATKSGKECLAANLTENNINDILKKQKAHQELAKKVKWRQNFWATANLIKVDTNENEIVHFLENHQSFLPKFFSYLPSLFLLTSSGLFLANYFGYISFNIIIAWLVLGLLITGFFLKKINKFYLKTSKAKDVFRQYFQLLKQIEDTKFTSNLLLEKQKSIQHHSKKASIIFNKFSKLLDNFDQRNNILFALIGNGFALWDLKHAYLTEKWIEIHKKEVKKWFEVIAFFDAHNSFGNFVFNHPQYVFPTITNSNYTIKATKLGHPLLNKEKRIDNDFSIKNNHFFIITGANMAGKSTFLRTVSLNIVMANSGIPVCAEKMEYQPIKLITSMRTSDSLSDDESYFFSELKRLKFIVEAIKNETYFIILDEILKGTNSQDKATGSRKFVKKLVSTNATGIIATHDLSLCKISTEQHKVKNYYFDAEIINDELFFDYTLKNGICQNMNASFLLNKMGII